jgi:hypothetical protein
MGSLFSIYGNPWSMYCWELVSISSRIRKNLF